MKALLSRIRPLERSALKTIKGGGTRYRIPACDSLSCDNPVGARKCQQFHCVCNVDLECQNL